MASLSTDSVGIEYLAVVRAGDGTIVADMSFDHASGYDYPARVAAIASAPALLASITKHGTVTDGTHHICILLLGGEGGNGLLVAVCDEAFPKARRVLPSAGAAQPRLLPELADAVSIHTQKIAQGGSGSLSRALRPTFQQLKHKFSDASACGDKLGAAQEKADTVRSSMIATMDKVMERGEKLEGLVDKAEHINDSAGQFQNTSVALRRKMQWRYYKVMCLIFMVAAAIVAYIVVPIVIRNRNKDD